LKAFCCELLSPLVACAMQLVPKKAQNIITADDRQIGLLMDSGKFVNG
jgi:hypothetical protein